MKFYQRNILYIYTSIKKLRGQSKMAFLLLLHEKMRLQRKVNKLTLRQLQLSGRKERITNNISKVQKMYASKQTQLEKSAQLWQSQMKNSIYNSLGLGIQNQMFNPMSGGITSYVANMMGGMLYNGGKQITLGDKTISSFSEAEYKRMMSDYMTTGLRENLNDDKKGSGTYGNNKYNKAQVEAFMYAMQTAQAQQQQAQFMAQQMSNQYQANVSVWLEAAQAQLEEEQNAALLPLEAEETEIEADNTTCETQLADAKARLESIKQACSEGIKESAPSFGLG